MSHFTTLVLVEKKNQTEEEILNEVEKLLEPFDENLEVDPYTTECACIGNKAYNEAFEYTNSVKHIDEYRKEYWQLPPEERPKWKDFISDFEQILEEKMKNHPLYRKPDPDCSRCNGTGKYETTYNPNSKWDWWEIGGRWDGKLMDGSRSFFDTSLLERNMRSTEELLDSSYVPFAILTPDGHWFERGEMLWFAIVRNEKDPEEWEKEYRDVLKEHPNHWAVLCDLHI